MATKSITPSNDQLEIEQLAEAELERLQKQVTASTAYILFETASHTAICVFFSLE